MPRSTQAIINLTNIASNYAYANSLAPESNNIAVIKANAYGHGMLEVANFLEPKVPAFGVAIFEEAMKLRQEGITKPILVFQGVNCQDDLVFASEKNIWLTLHNSQQVDLLLQTLLPRPVRVFINIDSGMHRLGFLAEQLPDIYNRLKVCSSVNDEIVFLSHFSCANNLSSNKTLRQLDDFNRALLPLENGIQKLTSLSNSSALAGWPQTHSDWNRPGIMLYGVPLFDTKHKSELLLHPSMTFQSEVIGLRNIAAGESVGYGENWTATKESTIATIAVGYGDGYPRQCKNGTPVLIRGKKASLVGRVSMDLICVDATYINGISIGDEVELWGENLAVDEVAKYADAISYDLLTGVSARVPRFYQK